MIQEEKLKYNEWCAIFRGGIYSKHAEAWGFGNAKNIGTMIFNKTSYNDVIQAERFEKELKFHSDWNWINEMIDAISQKFGEAPLFKAVYQKWLYENNSNQDFLIFRLPKNETVEAINQFLIWYNEQNQSN